MEEEINLTLDEEFEKQLIGFNNQIIGFLHYYQEESKLLRDKINSLIQEKIELEKKLGIQKKQLRLVSRLHSLRDTLNDLADEGALDIE